jgi:hypothetical protein
MQTFPPQNSLRFYREANGEIQENIWRELTSFEDLRINALNHELNCRLGVSEKQKWMPVINDISVIEKGMIFDESIGKYIFPTLRIRQEEASMQSFLIEAEAVINSLSGKRIGVQCSGGLDSSLIIGILRYFGVPHSLIGLKSDRYEFRTEKTVQAELIQENDSNILIDFEDHLPMSRLERVPKHQYPDSSCLNFNLNNAMASACKELGVQVLISGAGGDVLLGTEAGMQTCSWTTGIFFDHWSNDLIYKIYDVEVHPFFANKNIANTLWNLRRGQPEDIEKRWARIFFNNFLPKKLSKFSYRSDFWGLYIDGLINALPFLLKIQSHAFELTGDSYFDKDNIRIFEEIDFRECNQQVYQKIEARCSLAIWVCSLLGSEVNTISSEMGY